MRFAILQTNLTIGDARRNGQKIDQLIRNNARRADLFVTQELALTGYPPRDLLSQKWLLTEEAQALESLRALSAELGVGILVGHTETRSGAGKPLYNCASLFDKGALVGRVRKRRIPGYDIFEEERFFEPGPRDDEAPLEFRGRKLSVAICEDHWTNVLAFGVRDVRAYPRAAKPTAKADFIVNLSASPYAIDKRPAREDLFTALSAREDRPLLYVNGVGGQDDLLFDGASFAVSPRGGVEAQATAFGEEVLCVEWDGQRWQAAHGARPHERMAELEAGLVLGLGDFFRKSGATKAVLGLSGGIDSAVCAVLAARALGAENVLGVSLPSRYTSDLSRNEAKLLADALGMPFREVPIGGVVDESARAIGVQGGLAAENLQSRARGLLLTTLANQEGRLVLSTGNKSELAMGYATLYGDMCGALAPIGDLYKTEVYALAHQLNAGGRVIPPDTISRPPTAELAPGQKDSDSLPDYAVLDGLLRELIENGGETVFAESGWDAILAPRFTVREIRRRYLAQEFKRRQSAPILKVHQRSFGSGWRMPIAKGAPPV